MCQIATASTADVSSKRVSCALDSTFRVNITSFHLNGIAPCLKGLSPVILPSPGHAFGIVTPWNVPCPLCRARILEDYNRGRRKQYLRRQGWGQTDRTRPVYPAQPHQAMRLHRWAPRVPPRPQLLCQLAHLRAQPYRAPFLARSQIREARPGTR